MVMIKYNSSLNAKKLSENNNFNTEKFHKSERRVLPELHVTECLMRI